MATNKVLAKNWLVVKDWNEAVRYQTVSHQKAKKLYAAVADKPDGMMQWIRAHW